MTVTDDSLFARPCELDTLRAAVEALRARLARPTRAGNEPIGSQARPQSPRLRATDAILQVDGSDAISRRNSAAGRIFDLAQVELLRRTGNRQADIRTGVPASRWCYPFGRGRWTKRRSTPHVR